MIVIVHNKKHAIEVFKIDDNQKVAFNKKESIISVLKKVSIQNPKSLIIWVFEPIKEFMNRDCFGEIFHHKNIMASYAVNNEYVISERIGYVEKTPYTNIKRNVNYPTWQMSSDIGGICAEVLNTIISTSSHNENFDFFLSAMAKRNMSQGLLCYSNPMLITSKQNGTSVINIKNSNYLLFRFVKQHYKRVWLFNLLLCFIIFEKRFPFIPFIYSLFFRQNKKSVELNPLHFKSSLQVIEDKTVDVIIPTIGRKDSLLNVLKDLSEQTFLPKRVIVVEQSPLPNSQTELDYLTGKSWPFEIIHKFINQTGACNARNMALKLVKSEWVLLGDDDNRFGPDLIERLFKSVEQLGVTIATTMYVQPNEKMSFLKTNQTDIFGSGNSMIKSSLLKNVSFDMAFEFGYGEDSDFGMQLRKAGSDVIYFPEIKITHLKLPFGGFRTKHAFSWENDKIQPKPSPTIMLLMKKHYNIFQKRGYKYVLFLKFYKKQAVKNPFVYFKQAQKQWKSSEYWSEQLTKNNHA